MLVAASRVKVKSEKSKGLGHSTCQPRSRRSDYESKPENPRKRDLDHGSSPLFKSIEFELVPLYYKGVQTIKLKNARWK